MNIGFDAKRAFNNLSGLGNYSRSSIDFMVKYFPKNNYTLFTPSTENNKYYKASENSKIIEPKGYINNVFHSYWRTFKLVKAVKKNKIDVYHGLTNELPYKVHKTNAKLIVTIHDLIFIRHPELYNSIDRKIYYQKFKYACEIADIVIAISEQTKTDIINFLGIDEKKIEVVYQSCSPSFYHEVDTHKKIDVSQKYNLPVDFILNVGTIEKRKNSLLILKAIHQHNIDIPLIIVGRKTEYQDEIEAYAQKHKIQNKLLIINNMPMDDLPAVYQQANMLVYPSLFEGFGIPILEGLFSKIPVITTKGGCFSEAGGMNSLYVDPENVEDMAAAINKLNDDSKERKSIVEAGYKFAQNFHEENVAGNLMNIYLK